jgi:hypothetical protein
LRGVDGWRKIGGMMIARAVALVALAVTLLAAPLAAGAQSPDKAPLVGILDNGVPRLFMAFREGLRELGHVEGTIPPAVLSRADQVIER